MKIEFEVTHPNLLKSLEVIKEGLALHYGHPSDSHNINWHTCILDNLEYAKERNVDPISVFDFDYIIHWSTGYETVFSCCGDLIGVLSRTENGKIIIKQVYIPMTAEAVKDKMEELSNNKKLDCC